MVVVVVGGWGGGGYVFFISQQRCEGEYPNKISYLFIYSEYKKQYNKL